MRIAICALIFAAALNPAVAHSAAIWEFEESGVDVVGTLSGSLDLTGAILVVADTTITTVLDPSTARLARGGGIDLYRLSSSPSNFGPGGEVSLGGSMISSGDSVDVLGGTINRFTVPDTYTSLDPLTGTITYTNTELAALGITPGTYIFTLPSDTITLVFTAAVPLPAALPLFIVGLGCAGFASVRRLK